MPAHKIEAASRSRRSSALSQSSMVSVSTDQDIRSFGVSVSPAMALEVVETVRDRALILKRTKRLVYFVDGDYRP